MKVHTIVNLFLFIGVIACDSNRVYEDNIDLEDALWLVDDIQKFEFEINDVKSRYGLHFNIRSTLSYPFQNIYIKYNLRDSTDNVLKSELLEFYLFDTKTGEPQGDGLGDLFDNRFPLIEEYKFNYAGNYSVDLQQFMRLDSLPMVVSVGVRVAVQEETE